MKSPSHKILRNIVVATVALQCSLMLPLLQSHHLQAGDAAPPSHRSTLAAEFASPPQTARPQVRFWTPGAAVTDAGLREDIDTIAKSGFGGLEINAFPVPKGIGPEFRWGTKAWNHLMNVAANEAGKDGITVDFANGPQWPIAMPDVKSASSPASLYELTYGSVIVQPGRTYNGVVPPRRKVRPEGKPRLDAILAYRLTGKKLLKASSVIDLTANSHIDITDNTKSTIRFTAPQGPDPWVLFSFWEQPAAEKVAGYYVVDHFSRAGAVANEKYWRRIALPVLGKNIKYVRSIFDDSLEYAVTMEWTRGMRRIFEQQHGYDITPYLPFIGVSTTFPANDVPGYKPDNSYIAEKVEHDYRQTLTTLYTQDFLQPMEQMAERHGLTVRAQVAYNKPMQIETSVLAAGIPETEALGRESIDMQRYMAGAVHLTHKRFYSIETSAERSNNYGQTFKDILWWIKRAWAAGVNIERLHGESYSGQFNGPGNVRGQLPGQTWPGYSAFKLRFSNNWTRQTSLAALRQTLAYIARVNYIMQKKAKVDIAIYDDSPDIYVNKVLTHGDGQAVYPDGGTLNAYGYSYDFVSPALLDLPQAKGINGRIDPSGPAYKALIVHDVSAMTMPTIQRLRKLALADVKILFVGHLPRRNASYGDQLLGHSDADIRAAISGLVRLPSVVAVSNYADVPAALRRSGVFPDAEPAVPTNILCQHRKDTTGNYYYFYNYNKVSNKDSVAIAHTPGSTSYPSIGRKYLIPKTAQYSVVGKGQPYLLNAWTGEIVPIPQFIRSGGRIRFTIRLAGDQAAIVAVMTNRQALQNGLKPAKIWATESDAPAGGLAYQSNGKLVLRTTQAGSYTVRMNTGQTCTTSVSGIQSPYDIKNWKLEIASIGAPSDGSTLFGDSTWKTLGPFHAGTFLKPWNEISPSLARVSGIGTYTAMFSLDRGWEQGGSAYLDLGAVDGYFSVTLNGKRLSPQDQVDATVDVGRFARAGINVVKIQVASTLYNRVVHPGKSYGLLGTHGVVTVSPYRFVSLCPKPE